MGLNEAESLRRDGWWAKTRRGWGVLALLAGAALLLLAGGNLLLDGCPVTFELRGHPSSVTITVDDHTQYLPLAKPLRAVRFLPAEPYRREYQIDGSDSTNSLNLDTAYFSGLSFSLYYRFQSILRDEDSYSRWQDLEVWDPEGRPLLQQSRPEEGVDTPLPQTFHLTVDLHRLEVPRTLELVDEAGTVLQIELNRNDRYLRITRLAPDLPPRELVHTFFPNDWLPPAAEVAYLAMRTAALAIILLLALTLLALVLALLAPVLALLAPVLPRRPALLLGRPSGSSAAAPTLAAPALPAVPLSLRREWLLPLLAAAATLAAAVYSAVVLFDRSPHILDAVSYYFQGKILASGALAAPAPPVPGAFPTPFTVVRDGRWFSQYPPGAPLVLALGFLLGVPWLVEPLMAAAATLLVYAIGRRQYGRGTGLLAALLMAASPFLALQAGSFMSHVPAMFFVACFLYAATRYHQSPRGRWVVATAAALGGIFLVRESVALMYGLPVGLYLAFTAYRRRRRQALRDLVLALACLAPFGILYLLYAWALTGSPLLLPRLLFFAGDRFGFGQGVGFYGEHTLAAGLVNADEMLTSLAIYLFGWPYPFALALIALPFLLGRTAAWDRLHGLVFGLFVAVYVGYFYHGIALGPRYYFETLPSLVLLAGRGFSALAVVSAAILRAVDARSGDRGARAAVALLAVSLIACNLLYFVPRQAELYRDFNGLPTGIGPSLGDFVQRGLSGRKVAAGDALITTDSWWIYSVYLSPMNSPRLDGPAVLALVRDAETATRLREAFPHRTWYRAAIDEEGRLVLEEETPPAPGP